MNRIRNPSISSLLNKSKLIPTNKNFQCLYIIKANKSQTTAALQCAIAASLLYSTKSYIYLKNLIKGTKPLEKEYPKDTVILFQFPRALYTPSLSPFALKLETWCRAAEINYKNEFGMKKSSKGLIPFIRLNDYQVEDSEKCIEYLQNVFQKDLDSHLTEEQKAISRSIIDLCENSLKWCAVVWRFWHAKNGKKEMGLPLLSYWYFSYRVYTAGWYAGYSRFSRDELLHICKKDLNALNTLIGKKKYLFSDSKPSNVDFAIFGICAQIKFNDKGPINEYLNTQCPNLCNHVENIKSEFWKDWDQNIRITRLLAKNKKSFFKW